MVKMVAGLRRRAGMTPAEFRKYWREQHGPLIQRLPEWMELGVDGSSVDAVKTRIPVKWRLN